MTTPRTKLLLLALLSAFALSAASAASASALEMVWIKKGVELERGVKFEAESKSLAFKFKGTPFGVAVQIECKEEGDGWVENPMGGGNGKALSVMSFKGCTVTKPLKCTVKEPIVAEAKLEPALFLGAIWIEVKPVEAFPLTTITLQGAECSLKNKPFEVTGRVFAKSKNGDEEGTMTFIAGERSELEAGGKVFTVEGEMNLAF